MPLYLIPDLQLGDMIKYSKQLSEHKSMLNNGSKVRIKIKNLPEACLGQPVITLMSALKSYVPDCYMLTCTLERTLVVKTHAHFSCTDSFRVSIKFSLKNTRAFSRIWNRRR